MSSGLGIPHSRTLSTDYTEEFQVLKVQPAPLVAYDPDDDHDLHRESTSVSHRTAVFYSVLSIQVW